MTRMRYAPILLGLAACSTMQVQTMKDPQANLAQYSTYAWAPETSNAADQRSASILDETVRSSADQQLSAKGFRKVPPTDAQLLISYSAKTGNSVSYAPSPGIWGAEQVYVTPQGALTLHFVDPRTHRTVWQGTAADAVSNAGATQQQVAEAVKEIIQKYPNA